MDVKLLSQCINEWMKQLNVDECPHDSSARNLNEPQAWYRLLLLKTQELQEIGCKNKGDFCRNNEDGEFHQPQTYIRKWSKYMSYGRLQETRPGLETPCFMPILVRVDNVDQEDLTGLLFLNFFSHTSLRKLETCHENSWYVLTCHDKTQGFFEKHQKYFKKHGDL